MPPRPRFTHAIVVVCVLVFFWEIATMGAGILTGNVTIGQIDNAGALVPALAQQGQWWRIVTSAFLHASIIHIGLNMFSLWVLGRFIEPILGTPRTALVYTLSLIASGLGVTYFSFGNLQDPTLGASGAIFGIFGALFAIGLKNGPAGLQLVRANLGILLLNLVFTFAFPGISKQAHVAGLLTGFLLTLAIYRPLRPVRAQVIDSVTGEALDSTLEEAEPSPHR